MNGRSEGSSRISEQFHLLSESVSDLLLNPDSPVALKLQLERFVEACNNSLSNKEKEEITAIKIRAVLPEILSRLR